MDKRWVLIIIIAIIGLGSMYLVIENSTTVGSAISTFGKTTITLPEGFSVEKSDDASLELYNKHSNETIDIYDLGKENYPREELINLTLLYQDIEDYDKVSNMTHKKINNITVYQVQMSNENKTDIHSSFYYHNHDYIVSMNNYKDMKKLEKDLEFIICTMHPDYKQSQN
ncbi:hypothetical protein [uncultured Methanobrevibacter sp.]|uniref:hypothetical protein n=1 Tax=uncultured Methanobrevibacter sp. TaxID=253161 RepID=UPI0025DECEA4|nr:hypothetical protein [uncultured Methanobrevibacter sp.]